MFNSFHSIFLSMSCLNQLYIFWCVLIIISFNFVYFQFFCLWCLVHTRHQSWSIIIHRYYPFLMQSLLSFLLILYFLFVLSCLREANSFFLFYFTWIIILCPIIYWLYCLLNGTLFALPIYHHPCTQCNIIQSFWKYIKSNKW